MSLFGHLHQDAFSIFSRANRHLYAKAVLTLWQSFFADGVSFPSRNDVIALLHDVLRAHPDLWAEGEDFSDLPDIVAKTGRRIRRANDTDNADRQDKILERARGVYRRLLATGWLEEDAYGLKITVDMPPAAMVLVERLHSIEQGLSAQFGGVVVTIRNALAATLSDPINAAAGLNKAADTAVRFSRELRAVLSSLRAIEKSILSSGNLRERLSTFFEDFIARIVLKDFDSIYKTNHPYRFKGEILRYIEDIRDSDHVEDGVLSAYVEGRLASDRAQARLVLDKDLMIIETVFSNIDITYNRINSFRVRLESRLRNTVKYAEYGDYKISGRLITLIKKFDRAADRDEGPEGIFQSAFSLIGPGHMAQPRHKREALSEQSVRQHRPDPVADLYRSLLRRYNELFAIDEKRVADFLDKTLSETEMQGRLLAIDSVEDFLAFEQLRRYRHHAPAAFKAMFELTPAATDEKRDDEWISCDDFRIHRITSSRSPKSI